MAGLSNQFVELPTEGGPVSVGPDVVVVLSYKGADDTMACVHSLISGSPSVDVLVVDNGSEDGVLDRVAVEWPQVHTLQTGINLGFCGGMNAGLRWALERGARTVTVLNNDTSIPVGAMERLVARALEGSVVSPEVRYADHPDVVWFDGGLVDPETTLPRHRQGAELLRAPDAELSTTPILAGCCVTATSSVWNEVGLFDERFFLMFEDAEWSVRAGRGGVRLIVDHSVTIYHKVSASFKGPFVYLGLYYYTRNGLKFGSIYRPWSPRARLRFLRRHVLTAPVARLRQRDTRVALRMLLTVATAVAARVVGAYGRAPRMVEEVAQKWAARDAGSGTTVH